MNDADYDFTVDWFTPHWPNWLVVTANVPVSKILEIGSFEGRSACTMIDHFSKLVPLELFCIDNWHTSFEGGAFDMVAAERRFDRNVSRAIVTARNSAKVHKHKGPSLQHLTALLANGHSGSFDLVFVDGSHVASDVLSDLVLAYHLCKVGGLIICDDYLWIGDPLGSRDILNMPRLAIDAFIGIFLHRVEQWAGLPLYQVYLRKTA
jgi:predicted O-methyltransferase YrrM